MIICTVWFAGVTPSSAYSAQGSFLELLGTLCGAGGQNRIGSVQGKCPGPLSSLSLALMLILKQPLTPINEVNPCLLSTQLVPFRSSLTSGRYGGEHSWVLEPGDLLETQIQPDNSWRRPRPIPRLKF